jgi:hypothetical protein
LEFLASLHIPETASLSDQEEYNLQ